MSRINHRDRARFVASCARSVASNRTITVGAVRRRAAQWLAVGLVLALAGATISGCGRKAEEYIPTPEVAESAVRRALSAWQAGEPAGAIPNTQPSVFVTDNNRKPKQHLKNFEILGETPGRSGRTYVVELMLDAPLEKVKAEYIVVGIDPLWVFRREDYELLMHWDHHMPEPAGATQASSEPAAKQVNEQPAAAR